MVNEVELKRYLSNIEKNHLTENKLFKSYK